MRAVFSIWETASIDNDKLNSLVREGVIDAATDFSILAEVPSEPVNLEMSRLEITSFSLQRRSTGKLSGHSKDG